MHNVTIVQSACKNKSRRRVTCFHSRLRFRENSDWSVNIFESDSNLSSLSTIYLNLINCRIDKNR